MLLYKVFKLYFVEQESKWVEVIEQLKLKIKYLKELNKTVIQRKNNHVSKIEKINDILFAHRPTKENIQDHKLIINELLQIINDKKDQIYLIESEYRIIHRELNFWVTDFDKIKNEAPLRERCKKLNIDDIKANIEDEMSHKTYNFC